MRFLLNQIEKKTLWFKIMVALYVMRERYKVWACKKFGHRPGKWIDDIKPLPWQIKMKIRLPKRLAICKRCGHGIEEF